MLGLVLWGAAGLLRDVLNAQKQRLNDLETREGLPVTRAGRCQADEIAQQICDTAFSLYKSANQD